MQNEIPLWLVASLGRKVALVNDFTDGVRTYPAGSVGILVSIRGVDMPSVSVDVCLNPDDPTDWERFSPSELRAASGSASFSIDLERGVIAF